MVWFRVFLPLLIFMHGFLAAPLQVECISQDGRCLIEILGQDPCHESPPDRAVPARAGATLTGMLHQVDTCVDIMIDGAAELKVCHDFSPVPRQARIEILDPPQLHSEYVWIDGMESAQGPAAVPLQLFQHPTGNLRI